MLAISIIFILTIFYFVQNKRKADCKTFLCVVLGDTGHSPRMLSHCVAAKKYGYTGILVGYNQSPVHSEAASIQIINTPAYPKLLQTTLPKLINFPIKALINSIFLTYTICFKCYNTNYSKVILQNPPSIPTIAILSILKYVCNFKFIIDWHNYGYTIMEANDQNGVLVKICKIYEFLCGRWADHHFTVTQAMKLDLTAKAFINQKNITVLYDKPGKQFRTNSRDQSEERALNSDDSNSEYTNSYMNSAHSVSKILDRPDFENLPVIISSTSWTKDEDFGLLFDTIEGYDNTASIQRSANRSLDQIILPKIGVIITGKGPEKQYYTKKIKNKKGGWQNVIWCLPWLEADDYPKILKASTLGVCLHRSSSKLDLPMKVVDMLGSGLPVLALEDNYECIRELVKPGENGETFKNSEELLYQISKFMYKIDEISPKDVYSKSLREFRDVKNSWECEWLEKVGNNLSIFEKVGRGK